MKKKRTLLLFSLLCSLGAWAETVKWYSDNESWSQGSGGGNTFAFGVITPGTSSDFYELSSFEVSHNSGSGKSTSYACISSVPYTGVSLSADQVLAVSTTSYNPSNNNFHSYTLDKTVTLRGGTTYYIHFLSSNVASSGYYTVQKQRVGFLAMASSSNWKSGYTPGYFWSTTIGNNFVPGFKADLTVTTSETPSAIDVTYKVVCDGVVVSTSSPTSHLTGDIPLLPGNEGRAYCSYAYYSDASCETPLSKITSINSTVYAKCSYVGSFSFASTSDAPADYTYYMLETGGSYYDGASTRYYAYCNTEANTVLASTTASASDDYLWALVGNPYSYMLYCKAGYYLKTSDDSMDPIQITTEKAEAAHFGLYRNEHTNDSRSIENILPIINETAYVLVNTDNNYKDKVSYWKGSPTVKYRGIITGLSNAWLHLGSLADFLGPLITNARSNYLSFVGEGMNTVTDSGNLGKAITTAETDLANGTEANYAEDLEAINTAISALTLNMPSANTFMRIKSYSGSKYVKAAAAGQKMGMATTNDDATTIFLFNDNNKLISYSNGLGYKNVYTAVEAGGSISTYSFTSAVNGAFCKYSIKTSYNSADNYLYCDGSKIDRNTDDSQYYDANTFTLEEVTSLPVTLSNISGHGFASFYTPVGISSLPDGVKAYIASVDGDRIRFTNITDIPANTGVILYQPTYTEGAVNLTIGDASSSTTGNVLNGIVASTPLATVKTNLSATNILTMQNDDNKGLGFYQYNGTNLNGFRVFVDSNDAVGVKSFVFDFDDDDATGIVSLLEKTEEGTAIYNIAGQRLSKMQKGINIVNGKKILK